MQLSTHHTGRRAVQRQGSALRIGARTAVRLSWHVDGARGQTPPRATAAFRWRPLSRKRKTRTLAFGLELSRVAYLPALRAQLHRSAIGQA